VGKEGREGRWDEERKQSQMYIEKDRGREKCERINLEKREIREEDVRKEMNKN
jgi:hypothetical protein